MAVQAPGQPLPHQDGEDPAGPRLADDAGAGGSPTAEGGVGVGWRRKDLKSLLFFFFGPSSLENRLSAPDFVFTLKDLSVALYALLHLLPLFRSPRAALSSNSDASLRFSSLDCG